MEYHEWVPAYEAVLEAFGYSKQADETSRDWLEEYCKTAGCTAAVPDLAGKTVAILGAAPTKANTDRLTQAEYVIAASSAGPRLATTGRQPDLVVTDLDGDPAGVLELAENGVPIAVHAHGDNRETLEELLPTFPAETVLPTTQAAPSGPVVNFGGFTDGDRAAFLADHCGANRLVFSGWDFDDPAVSDEKARKLSWAARLLYWLEKRRGEQFSILDGRRSELSIPWQTTPQEDS